MTLLFDDVVRREDASRPSIYVRALRGLGRWVRAVHARRSRRIALTEMLEMEPHRLRDIGISPQDVTDALAQARR